MQRRALNEVMYLQATTNGQKSVVKELSITVIINCKFVLKDGISKDDDKVAILDNVLGGEFNLAKSLISDYEFNFNANLCPNDSIFLYKEDAKETMELSGLIGDFNYPYVPGMYKVYWRTGSSEA